MRDLRFGLQFQRIGVEGQQLIALQNKHGLVIGDHRRPAAAAHHHHAHGFWSAGAEAAAGRKALLPELALRALRALGQRIFILLPMNRRCVVGSLRDGPLPHRENAARQQQAASQD